MATQVIGGSELESRAALAELVELLCRAAAPGSPSRTAAVQYTRCRDVLLCGPLRAAVPGFVVQCVSIFKFQDFITLFHWDGEARTRFIRDAFGVSGSGGGAATRRDAFNDFDF